MKKLLVFILTIVMLLSSAAAEKISDPFFDQDFIRRETDNFSFIIPKTWYYKNNANGTFNFKAKNEENSIGGLITVTEMNLNAYGYSESSSYDSIYASIASGLKSSPSISNVSTMVDRIRDTPIMIMDYYLLYNGAEIPCVNVLYVSEGYAVSFAFCDESEDAATVRTRGLTMFCTIKSKSDPSAQSLNTASFDGITVVIEGASLYTSGEDQYLIVEYTWQHSNPEPQMFTFSVSTEAYQDGIQCDTGFLADYSGTKTTKIQANTPYTCYDAFLLRNTDSPVTVYVDKYVDIMDKYPGLQYTFTFH